jgi:hypothetical protein
VDVHTYRIHTERSGIKIYFDHGEERFGRVSFWVKHALDVLALFQHVYSDDDAPES